MKTKPPIPFSEFTRWRSEEHRQILEAMREIPLPVERPPIENRTESISFDRVDLAELQEVYSTFYGLGVVFSEADDCRLSTSALDSLTAPTIEKFAALMGKLRCRFEGDMP